MRWLEVAGALRTFAAAQHVLRREPGRCQLTAAIGQLPTRRSAVITLLKKANREGKPRAASLPESFSQERSTDEVSEGGRYLLATADGCRAAASLKARLICCPARIRGSAVARYN